MAKKDRIETNLISWGWDIIPGEDLFVAHVAEMCPGFTLNPSAVLSTDFWQLDYSFTPHRIKIGDTPWFTREKNVGYLIPRTKRWREGPLASFKGPPHKCSIVFAVSPRLGFDQKYWHKAPTGYARFPDPDGVLANAMTRIASTARSLGDNGYWTTHAMVWELLQSLMETPASAPDVYTVWAGNIRQPTDPFISKAKAYLQMHLAERIALPDVAKHVGMAESTLSHHFKIAGEPSPMKTLQQLRILRAKALLAKGWKLDAIAEATGFYGGFHLSRVFKKATGMSPSAFLGNLK